MRTRMLTIVLAWTLLAAPAFAQTPTGAIAGRVLDETGGAMAGVTVTVTSPSLQGERVTATTASGDFLIALLPPGDYTVMFDRDGFQTMTRTVGVAVTQTVTLNETMALSGLEAEVVVIGTARAFERSTQAATTFRQDLMATLPSSRNLAATLLMAPGVHATGPSGGFSIGGAASFQNVYTVNGVSVTENVRGEAIELYIEDALQETTVVTSGVSAEYGRFGGGLVNVVTRSGGNLFSGSYRASFANDSWRSKTAFGTDEPLDATVPTHEYTIGGPIAKDRLWFFHAGRFQAADTSETTAAPTALSYTRTRDEKRYEIKLTYSPVVGHTVTGSYLRSDLLIKNRTQFNVLDLASLGTQDVTNQLGTVHYAGVWGGSLFAEAQYSARRGALIAPGALTTDLVRGTTIIDGRNGFRFWAPSFCGVCGADNRDNDDLVLKATYFASGGGGSHTLVFGYDRYNDHRETNNHQSASDYRIQSAASIVQDTSVFPVFAGPTFIIGFPIRQASQGTDLVTHSAFVNDTWRVGDRVSVNLGVRLDKNQGENAAGETVSDDSLVSPRLGVVVDPTGGGRWTVSAGFAAYASALSTTLADVSAAGNPAVQVWFYQGPPINAGQGPLTPTGDAVGQLFDWFFANGGTARPTIFAQFPGLTPRVDGSLTSPNAKEFSLGVDRQIARGSVRADFVYRTFADFYGDRTDLSTGVVFDDLGRPIDLTLRENTDVIDRQYRALSLQGTQRIGTRVDLGANYTVSRARGNFDPETANAGPIATRLLSYPEYVQSSWFSPEGDLALDQRHRLRLWGVVDVPMARRVGTVNLAVLHQFASGVPYGAVGGVNVAPFVANPGYVSPSGNRLDGTWDYYFTSRDAFRTESTNRTDLSANYAYQIGRPGRSVDLFLHAEVLNVFNVSQLCGCGDTVFDDGGSVDIRTINQAVLSPGQQDLQPFNPFTTTPVQGVNWDLGPDFGTAVTRFAYTSPRTFRFNVGVRF